MTNLFADRTTTVAPPHTSQVTIDFLDSISDQNLPVEKVSKPFFVSPPNRKDETKGKMIYDWTKDHFVGQMLEAVALDLATSHPDDLDRLTLFQIKEAFARIGDPVEDVSFMNDHVGIKMEYADNRFSIPIKRVNEMAQQSLVHLTQ